MPFEEAIGRLKAYEDRLKSRSSQTSGEAGLLLTQTDNKLNQKSSRGGFTIGGRGRGSSHHDRGGRSGGRGRGSARGRGGRGNSLAPRDSSNNRQRGRDKSHIMCFNCEEYGHYASECKAPKKRRRGKLDLDGRRRTRFTSDCPW